MERTNVHRDALGRELGATRHLSAHSEAAGSQVSGSAQGHGREHGAHVHARSVGRLPWLRELIRTQFGNDARPQMVLRLGTVIQTSVIVRRPPASVFFAGGSHG